MNKDLMRDELEAKYKYHPRILEMRICLIKNQLVHQYGEEVAMVFLKMLSDVFSCNWSLLVGIFNKDAKILNNTGVDSTRKKQEIIFMGYLFNETRYYVTKHYLSMNVNYLYQAKSKHSPETFATDEWCRPLDDEVVVCGVRSYSLEAKRFITSFDGFVGIFK